MLSCNLGRPALSYIEAHSTLFQLDPIYRVVTHKQKLETDQCLHSSSLQANLRQTRFKGEESSLQGINCRTSVARTLMARLPRLFRTPS